MLEISLSEVNYSKKGKETALIKSNVKNKFFKNFVVIVSIPFAIIIVAGNIKNKSSNPFLAGISSAKKMLTSRCIIKSSQLFLKELLIEKVFGDFTSSERKERLRTVIVSQ
jgi:hypothetical protein